MLRHWEGVNKTKHKQKCWEIHLKTKTIYSQLCLVLSNLSKQWRKERRVIISWSNFSEKSCQAKMNLVLKLFSLFHGRTILSWHFYVSLLARFSSSCKITIFVHCFGYSVILLYVAICLHSTVWSQLLFLCMSVCVYKYRKRQL